MKPALIIGGIIAAAACVYFVYPSSAAEFGVECDIHVGQNRLLWHFSVDPQTATYTLRDELAGYKDIQVKQQASSGKSPVTGKNLWSFRFGSPIGNYWGAYIEAANGALYFALHDGTPDISMQNGKPIKYGQCRDGQSRGL